MNTAPRARAVIVTAFVFATLPISARAQRQTADSEIAVVQLNDIYRIDAVENGAAGGIGRVVTLVERTRRETGKPVLVLHAGDMIAPSLESRYFAGLQMIDALNFLHARAPLLVVPGNHEFDERTPGMLAGAVKASRFPWLAGNLVMTTGDSTADRRMGRDTVINVGGARLGIFTLTFLDAPRSYASADTAFVVAAERQINRLETAGAEVIVGLTHLPHETDRRIAALRRTHPRFLWIAGGHEHYLLADSLTDTSALITKGDANARRVWRVLIGLVRGQPTVRARAVVLDSLVPIDPRYRGEVQERWLARLRERIPFFDQVIGRSTTPLDGREETVRNAESAWGNWLTDRMRDAFVGIRAEMAVLNGGTIRVDDMFSGPIRWEHLARTFGFPTRVGLVWMRGADVRAALEHSVSGGAGEGRFLQVSGLRVRFDKSRPSGGRLTDVQVDTGGGTAPLEDQRVYTVAVSDFLYQGGDGYRFKQVALLALPAGPDLRLMAFDALSAALARGEAIAPVLEGRLVNVAQ